MQSAPSHAPRRFGERRSLRVTATGRQFSLTGLLAVLIAAPALAGPTLTHLSADRVADGYEASCRLEGGLGPEVEEEIAAGLATTIEYRLHVYRRRSAFFDQLVSRHRVQCTARYDIQTQQYTLTRRIDGDLQETKVTDDPAAMREFMTKLRSVPLVRRDALRPGEEYYLKAKSELGLVWRFYLIPWPMDTNWERVPLDAGNGETPHGR